MVAGGAVSLWPRRKAATVAVESPGKVSAALDQVSAASDEALGDGV